jgi:hypothetical protein
MTGFVRVRQIIFGVFLFSADPSTLLALDRSEFPFRQKILSDSYSGRYAGQSLVVKKDIFITGDQITIDTPIMSNGGDVVIIGNDIVIAAPIDTRIYLDHAGYFEQKAGCSSQAWAIQNLPNAKAAFNDYYLKTMIWNSNRKWWELGVANSFAELPQGHTPAFCAGDRQPGAPAAGNTIIQENARSGSITIIGGSVRFCDECPRPDEASFNPNSVPNYPARQASDDASPDFAECKSFGSHRPNRGDTARLAVAILELPFPLTRIRTDMLLVTSGMSGGRSGLGQTTGCLYPGNARFRCMNDRGGAVGQPGPAGHAGNIRLVLINQFSNDPHFRNPDYYKARSDFRGGETEYHPLWTPDFERLNKFPNRCVFTPASSAQKFRTGEDGTFEVLYTDSAGALDVLGATLTRLDARVERDYSSLVTNDSTILQGMTPSEHFTLTLLKTVLRMQTELIENIRNTANARPPAVDKIFAGMPVGTHFGSSLTDIQRRLLAKITQLSDLHVNNPGNGFQRAAQYLVNSGGLFEMTGQDVMAQLGQMEIALELNQIRQKVIELANELGSLRIDLQEYFAGGRAKDLASVVSQLKGQIAIIEQKIKEQNTAPGWIEFTQWYANIVKLIYTGIIQPYEAGATTSAYGGMLTTAKEVYVRVSEFGKKDHSLYAQAAQLKEQAELASQVLLRFLRYVETERDAILHARVARLRELRDAKRRYLTKQLARTIFFDEILRQTIVHYLVNKNNDQWDNNISALLQLTNLNQPASTALLLPDRSVDCPADQTIRDTQLKDNNAFVRCVLIADHRADFSLYVYAGETYGRVPVLRLRPNQLPKTLQTFGVFQGRNYQIVTRE